MVENLRKQETVLVFYTISMTLENLKSELKNMPVESVLAIAASGGGWIPVESVRFKRDTKIEKPGMGVEMDMLILADIPRFDGPDVWTVQRLGGVLNGLMLPEDAHVVFSDLDGEVLSVQSVKQGHPDKFENAGTLVALSKNPWN